MGQNSRNLDEDFLTYYKIKFAKIMVHGVRVGPQLGKLFLHVFIPENILSIFFLGTT
jgi:hypothetical protein